MNDLYLKIVLTIIAVCLVAMTLRPIITPTLVRAYEIMDVNIVQSEIMDVNIVQIDGGSVGRGLTTPLPVEIRK